MKRYVVYAILFWSVFIVKPDHKVLILNKIKTKTDCESIRKGYLSAELAIKAGKCTHSKWRHPNAVSVVPELN